MKKIKMLSAALAALCMAVSLASCGGTDNAADTSKTETTTTTTAAETEDKTAEAEAEMKGETSSAAETTAAAEESAAETESTAEDNNAAYAYFDELNAEYESEGDTTFKKLDINITANHKHSLFGFHNGTNNRKFWSVDEDGNGSIILDMDKISADVPYQCSGYIYYRVRDIDTSSDSFHKADIHGNEVAVSDPIPMGNCEELLFIVPDGHVMTFDYTSGNYHYYVYSPDLKTKTELTTKPQFKNEHGEMTDYTSNLTQNNFIAGYKNRAYYYTGTGCGSYLDCETMEWVNFDLPEEFENGFGFIKSVGKYALCARAVFDMETLDTAYTFGGYNLKDYYGGDACIEFPTTSTADFYRLTPDSGNKESFKTYDNITKYSAVIDYDRYVVVDDYGVFVHTFEKGDSEETKAVSFE